MIIRKFVFIQLSIRVSILVHDINSGKVIQRIPSEHRGGIWNIKILDVYIGYLKQMLILL